MCDKVLNEVCVQLQWDKCLLGQAVQCWWAVIQAEWMRRSTSGWQPAHHYDNRICCWPATVLSDSSYGYSYCILPFSVRQQKKGLKKCERAIILLKQMVNQLTTEALVSVEVKGNKERKGGNILKINQRKKSKLLQWTVVLERGWT